MSVSTAHYIHMRIRRVSKRVYLLWSKFNKRQKEFGKGINCAVYNFNSKNEVMKFLVWDYQWYHLDKKNSQPLYFKVHSGLTFSYLSLDGEDQEDRRKKKRQKLVSEM